MWITYSCDGRDDETTKRIPELACPADRGVMKNADIPLNGGWINIRNPPKSCIFINKVRPGCGGGAPIAEHIALVSWKIYLSLESIYCLEFIITHKFIQSLILFR